MVGSRTVVLFLFQDRTYNSIDVNAEKNGSSSVWKLYEKENCWRAFLITRQGRGGLSCRQEHGPLQVQTGSIQMRCKEVGLGWGSGEAKERSLLVAFIFSMKYKTGSSAESADGEEELEI